MDYIDICLLKDEDGGPVLAIAPAWKIYVGDIVNVQVLDGKFRCTVEDVYTVEKDGKDCQFIFKCFGDEPGRLKVVEKLYTEQIEWPD